MMRFSIKSMRSLGVLLAVGSALLAIPAGRASAEIEITVCTLWNKTDDEATSSGPAAYNREVRHVGEAMCDCEHPDLEYLWFMDYTVDPEGLVFVEPEAEEGGVVEHEYGIAGAWGEGNRFPDFGVYCNSCESEAWASEFEELDELQVDVIIGIEVTLIGDIADPDDDGRLCFDDVLDVSAETLPEGVGHDDKIDWWVTVGAVDSLLLNNPADDIPMLTSFPVSNSSWGTHLLWVNLDNELYNSASESGELYLTGEESYLSGSQNIKVFYEEGGFQNPNGALDPANAVPGGDPLDQPNWFYYWTQTSANAGNMIYDTATAPNGYPRTDFEDAANGFPTYMEDDYSNASGETAFVGADQRTFVEGIDFFAWTARHESQHQTNYSNWYTVGMTAYGYTEATTNQGVVDTDWDFIPDGLEAAAAGGPYTVPLYDTYHPTSVPPEPIDDGQMPARVWTPLVNDDERFTVSSQSAIGGVENFKSEDWAMPGQQWD